MLKYKTAKIFIIAGVAIIVSVIVAWHVASFLKWSGSEKIADGVKIGGYDLSGYDRQSAVQFLNIHFSNELNDQTMEISYEDISSKLSVGSFTRLSFERVLDQAFSVAHSGVAIQDFITFFKSRMVGTSFDPEMVFDDDALASQLESVSAAYSIEAKNASISTFDPNAIEGEELTVMPHSTGRKLDISKTAESIKSALMSGRQKAEAHTAQTEPEITEDMVMGITASPVISEYTINGISSELENAIYQAIGSGIYEILVPGQEISIIEFSGQEDYIYFDMPQEGEGAEYDKVLSQLIPTEIYLACILSELQVTERTMYELDAKNVPAGTSCIINREHDMKIKNSLCCPVIVRVGYNRAGNTGVIFCEIYRPEMKYKTLIRSILKDQENKTFVDIARVYVDNRGNTVESVVAETIEVS